MLGGHKRKAHEVVSLKNCLRIEDVACKVVDINTSERIRLASISTKSDQFGVGQLCTNGFGSEGGDGIVISDNTAIPL